MSIIFTSDSGNFSGIHAENGNLTLENLNFYNSQIAVRYSGGDADDSGKKEEKGEMGEEERREKDIKREKERQRVTKRKTEERREKRRVRGEREIGEIGLQK